MVTIPVTVVTGGSYAGAVAMNVSGLPAGVTASWSPASFTPVTNVSTTTATLTLTATSTAKVITAPLVVAAKGDGLSTAIAVSAQVKLAPAVQLQFSVAQVKMLKTANQQVIVTAVPVGGVTSSASGTGVVFAATALPAGISANWGVRIKGASGAIQTTLTLSGSSKAVAATSSIQVTVVLKDAVSSVPYGTFAPLSLVTQ